MKHTDFISLHDYSAKEIGQLFTLAIQIKRAPKRYANALKGKTLAMIFEKQSLRTRVTFETGIYQLGGQGIYLAPADISLRKRESVYDVGKNLERWCDGIMIRTFGHDICTGLAEATSIPVINGLTDLEHPCQALADFLTIREHKRRLKGLKVAFTGDGNNVANSLMQAGAKTGAHVWVASPSGHEPKSEMVELARQDSRASRLGAKIMVTNDPFEAAHDADVVYTDVWASMGQESESESRKKVFWSYQVNSELMAHAKPDALFLHCLPAHRGEEVTDEVIDSPQSVVFDEAENRLHAQKAVMLTLMK
ncbi:MAG: ornithine carbamoyltransferase [Acidobacteriia bacterium]|nr:ornithine carbamoyltransferase [Terriglobia bacterium]